MHPWRSKSCRRARSTVWCRVFGLNNLVAITTSAVLAVTPTALPQQQVSAPAVDADRTQIAALPGRTGQARFVNDSSLRPPGTDRSMGGGGVPSGLPSLRGWPGGVAVEPCRIWQVEPARGREGATRLSSPAWSRCPLGAPATQRPGSGPNCEHSAEYPGALAPLVLLLLHDFPDPGRSHRFPLEGSSPPSDTFSKYIPYRYIYGRDPVGIPEWGRFTPNMSDS